VSVASAALAWARKRVVCSARLRAVMSRAIFDAPMMRPAPSRTGEMVSETSTRRPSFVIRTVS
jgi:hypothetical protein